MPSSPPQKEEAGVDRQAEVQRLFDAVDETQGLHSPGLLVQAALVHSQLAVADELKGIRQTLVAMHTGSPVDAVGAEEAQR